MLEFKGKAVLGHPNCHAGVKYYQLSCSGNKVPQCGGTIFAYCGLYPEGEFSWGYDGAGPNIAAVTLLAISCGIECNKIGSDGKKWWTADDSLLRCGGYVDPKGLHPIPKPYCKDVPGLVKKQFKAFTEQVIANLPDNWTMTDEEIRAWLKDGTLPACITNKPKE